MKKRRYYTKKDNEVILKAVSAAETKKEGFAIAAKLLRREAEAIANHYYHHELAGKAPKKEDSLRKEIPKVSLSKESRLTFISSSGRSERLDLIHSDEKREIFTSSEGTLVMLK